MDSTFSCADTRGAASSGHPAGRPSSRPLMSSVTVRQGEPLVKVRLGEFRPNRAQIHKLRNPLLCLGLGRTNAQAVAATAAQAGAAGPTFAPSARVRIPQGAPRRRAASGRGELLSSPRIPSKAGAWGVTPRAPSLSPSPPPRGSSCRTSRTVGSRGGAGTSRWTPAARARRRRARSGRRDRRPA